MAKHQESRGQPCLTEQLLSHVTKPTHLKRDKGGRVCVTRSVQNLAMQCRWSWFAMVCNRGWLWSAALVPCLQCYETRQEPVVWQTGACCEFTWPEHLSETPCHPVSPSASSALTTGRCPAVASHVAVAPYTDCPHEGGGRCNRRRVKQGNGR